MAMILVSVNNRDMHLIGRAGLIIILIGKKMFFPQQLFYFQYNSGL